MITLNEKMLATTDISGRGGKERAIESLLEGDWERKNEPLYDLENPQGLRVEAKKQQNTQWFDLKKYYNLDAESKSIVMLFVCYKKQHGIDLVASCTLGEFLEFVVDHPDYVKGGWQSAIIQREYLNSQVAPQMQSKAKLNVRSFINDKTSPVDIHFKKDNN